MELARAPSSVPLAKTLENNGGFLSEELSSSSRGDEPAMATEGTVNSPREEKAHEGRCFRSV